MLAYVEYSEILQCVSWQSSATEDVKTTQTRLYSSYVEIIATKIYGRHQGLVYLYHVSNAIEMFPFT